MKQIEPAPELPQALSKNSRIFSQTVHQKNIFLSFDRKNRRISEQIGWQIFRL